MKQNSKINRVRSLSIAGKMPLANRWKTAFSAIYQTRPGKHHIGQAQVPKGSSSHIICGAFENTHAQVSTASNPLSPFCFVIKSICIEYTLKFSSHQQTVLSTDICICMITYHHFALRRKWSLSSLAMVLLSKCCPFSQFFPFIIHILHQPFCCIQSPKFYFFEPRVQKIFSKYYCPFFTDKAKLFFFFSFFWQTVFACSFFPITLANWL